MEAPDVIWQVHAAVPGRIRFEVPELRRRPALAAKLERHLRRSPGVVEARTNTHSATLLICYQPGGSDRWRAELAELLGVPVGALEKSRRRKQSPSEAAFEARAREVAERLSTGVANALAAVESATLRARIEEAPAARPDLPEDANAPRWHTCGADDVFAKLSARSEGLAKREAADRLSREGRNEIEAAKRRSAWEIARSQFTSTPVAMLGGSAILSAATGGLFDAGAILLVVGVNAAIGYAMEHGAERTISALAQPGDLRAPVLRDGQLCEIPFAEVVPGDVLVLQAGTLISADARLFEVEGLSVDESSLTGESEPAHKSIETIADAKTPLGSRLNMVYRGTLVAAGSGKAVVVATGPRTELGRIQQLAGSVEERRTPMQQQLDRLGQQLVFGAGAACAAVLGVGLLRRMPPLALVQTAVSLGVAAVPEGLPTVALATLARGVSRMRAEKVLVRKLSAVETLGATQVLCVDKTGTLTRNRMTVVALQAGLRRYEVQGCEITPRQRPAELEALLRVGAINSEVELKDGELEGSSTECALVQLALDAKLDVAALREQYRVHATKPRAENQHYVATLHAAPSGELTTVKGSPAEVLALCTHVLHDGETRPLGDEDRARIERENERMAAQPLRVLGCAQLERGIDVENLPSELVWLGLIGMEDPPRQGVGDVLGVFRQAGVRTIMMTGDQGSTAEGVARQVGLGSNGHIEVVDATELESAEPAQIRELVSRADVFARVSPAHKVNLVRALQEAGFVTAMTGDGVNDSPALKAADIGVAMGASGANAAREVADLVLADDDLQRMVTAMREGRTIYGDIRKAVRFVLATNASEIMFTFACVASGLGEPLTPLQLLWINIMTDIFPELALAVQPPESDVLARPPRDPERPMFTPADLRRTGFEGALIAGSALATHLASPRGPAANSVGFTTLVFAQLLHAISARSEERGLFDREPIPSNRWLSLTLGGSVALQLAVNLVPPLRAVLGLTPLGAADWARVSAGALAPLLVNESLKLARRSERFSNGDSGSEPPATRDRLPASVRA